MSKITIINKFKPPSPRWTYEPLPTFKRDTDRVKYTELWHQRYLEGHAGLTGPHIMFLQENHLKLIDGSIIRPIWREADEKYLFQPIDKSRLNPGGKGARSLMIIKRREFGLTSVGTFMGHYLGRMNKGITCNFTSDSGPHLGKLFTDKILVSQDHFRKDIRGSYDSREGGAINKTKNNVGMTIAMRSKNEFGEEIIKTTDFFCSETSESDLAVSKFSSTRAYYTFIDEAAIHKRVEALLDALQPVMMKGSLQLGFLLVGGSIEKSISQANLIRLKGLVDNRETYNMDYVFIPGYAALDEYMVNGFSDEKGAMEWILRRREMLDKNPNKNALNAFIKSHPLDEKELFEMGAAGFWEAKSMNILNQSKRDLEINPPPISPVEIVPMGSEIKVNIVKESPVTILRHPKEGVMTLFGIDSVMSGKESGDEKGSEFAAIGITQLDPADFICKPNEEVSYSPSCLYHERPDTVQGAYDITLDLILYYNKFGTPDRPMVSVMPEANAATADHFTSYMTAKGYRHLLAKRPDLSGKGHSDQTKTGVYMTNHSLEWGRRAINAWVQKYGYRNKMLEVILDLINLGAVNADIGSATLAAIIGQGLDYDAPPKPPEPPAPNWRHWVENGENIWVQEEQLIDDPNKPKERRYIDFMGHRTYLD